MLVYLIFQDLIVTFLLINFILTLIFIIIILFIDVTNSFHRYYFLNYHLIMMFVFFLFYHDLYLAHGLFHVLDPFLFLFLFLMLAMLLFIFIWQLFYFFQINFQICFTNFSGRSIMKFNQTIILQFINFIIVINLFITFMIFFLDPYHDLVLYLFLFLVFPFFITIYLLNYN